MTGDRSPLLRLPPELRSQTYEYLFEDVTIRLYSYTLYKSPGILYVSRQIYKETISLPDYTVLSHAKTYSVLIGRLSRLPCISC